MTYLEAHYYHSLALMHHGSYDALLKLKQAYGSWRSAFNKTKCARSLEADWNILEKNSLTLVLQDDKSFPALLREIPYSPHALYIKGALQITGPSVAIVGTRKASMHGKKIAMAFAQELANYGICVVSGLALGIDAAAHEGAVRAKKQTIAVLARGLDEIYPRQHEQLAHHIVKLGGAIISEYPPSVAPLPHMFLERNRLVAGMSNAVLIIEAPKRSGTLATARFAIEQNRDVLVVPGSIQSPYYEGSHELIKNGATLVTSVEDILHALGINPKEAVKKKTVALAKNEDIVLNVLNQMPDGAPIERVVQMSQLDERTVSQSLSTLIIEGVVSESMGIYRRA